MSTHTAVNTAARAARPRARASGARAMLSALPLDPRSAHALIARSGALRRASPGVRGARALQPRGRFSRPPTAYGVLLPVFMGRPGGNRVAIRCADARARVLRLCLRHLESDHHVPKLSLLAALLVVRPAGLPSACSTLEACA